MAHDHHHHHHHHVDVESMNSILWVSIILNMLFVLVEAGVGFGVDSLSLLSDAGHNLSDVLSLLLVLVGLHLAHTHRNKNYTYGYKKSTILISLLNAILLLVAVGAIMVESVHKFMNPVAVDGAAISWTAAAGILVNGITTLLLMKGQKKDLNVRGAFLHMAADTLVSVGVVVSGIIISFTGYYIIDPIISLVIAVVILLTTWELLRDSLRLSLDGIPEDISVDEVEKTIRETEHVVDVHHIHIWALSTTQNALTAHVVIDDWQEAPHVLHQLKHSLEEKNIHHSTLEPEQVGIDCHDEDCC